MTLTMNDWIAASILVLISVPSLAFLFQYGRAQLNFPQRLDRLMRLFGRRYETLPEGVRNVATFRCNTCDNIAACDAWMENDPDKKGYRAFCPNATLIDELSETAAGNATGTIPQTQARKIVQTDALARARHRSF